MSIPNSDRQFGEWVDRYNAYLNANPGRMGLTADQVNTLDLLHITWDTDYSAHTDAHAAAKVATTKKRGTRNQFNEMLRAYNRIIQASPDTTDVDREALGLTIPGFGPAVEELEHMDQPLPTIDRNERLTHNVTLMTMTPDGVKKTKPAGVLGCEVRRAIGTAPASADDMDFVCVASKLSFAIKYSGDDLGKLVTYSMRWISKDGEPGAWSEFKTATVAA